MKPEHKDIMKRRKRNICLTVAYDGTNYHGFQRQSPPVVAVQNVLEKRLAVIFGDTIELSAAGRTDTGVHAMGQVVNFFTDGTIPVERIPKAANNILPDDIAIVEAHEVDMDFSALHSAKRKTYEYRILQEPVRNPFKRNYAWQIPKALNVKAMRMAMTKLIGTHDFSSFRASGGAPMSPVRTMDIADIEENGSLLTLTFRSTGFLYHMVRNIVGTLADVGLSRKSIDDFERIIASCDRKNASPTAPACGLYLVHVEY
ncbi:MAG: tRNA pseudouridine(38-40) synthase TruA [Selenomonadaceae bacterium]